MAAALLNSPSVSDRKNPKIFLGLLAGGSGAITAIDSASAESTTIDVASVTAQSTAATTAITGVGAVLITMAFGMLVFSVATGVIRRVMGG